jgi:hypothetical protein
LDSAELSSSGRFLLVVYDTRSDFSDELALKEEARVIWESSIRSMAERGQFCIVELKTISKRQFSLPILPTKRVSAKRAYSSVLRRDANGSWRWLTNADSATGSCLPHASDSSSSALNQTIE